MKPSRVIAGFLLATVAGCASAEKPPPPRKPIAARPVQQRTGGISTGVLPLGFVPYDLRTLPLVSPDGQFVATRAGGPPSWETLLATSNAPVAYGGRIEIHRIDRRLGEAVFFRATGPDMLACCPTT